MNLIKQVWKKLVPAGRRPRRVWSGLYGGLSLQLDLQRETQVCLGLYERETYRPIARLARACAACIDIGAGKGELTCYWLRRFPGRPIVAVEPSPGERACLDDNLRANFETAPAALNVWPGFAGTGPATTHRELAELCAALPDPVFVKMDIDGGEGAVLENAASFLAAHPCRLLIEVHSIELERTCLALLARCGYAVQIVDFAWWRRWLREQRPIAHNRWLVAEPAPSA